jgi:F0F1-type ATP synthase membrane subunit b/b'
MKNIEKNYTIDEVAQQFGLSTRTLSRKFKDNMGMNYVRFLRALRITKSLELIAENKYNMYEIAMLVGYNSLSSFSNIFQKWTGKALQGTDRIKFDLSLGGTVKNPIFGFKGSSTANSLKDAVVAEAKSQIDAAKAKALDEADRLKKEAEAKLQAEKDRILKEANTKKVEIEARVQKEKAAIEAKARTTVDSIKKAAADRAKKILEEQKKSVLDGIFKRNKNSQTDTTKNIRRKN